MRISLASTTSASIVAGSVYTYGEGAGEAASRDGRFFPLTLSLDITDALRQLDGDGRVDAYLDILDPHGRMLAEETLYLESVEIKMIVPLK